MRAGALIIAALLAAGDAAAKQVAYVVSDAWHSGLVLSRAALGPLAPAEAADFPDAPWLEFGWGDRNFYPNPQPSVADALAAGLKPTPAVMHVAPRARPPAPDGARSVVRVTLTEAGFAALAGAIDATFERPDGRRAAPIAQGLYPDSLFYPATGRFHLFNTCNTWVARMLAAGGAPISAWGVVTAGDLMERVRPLATSVETPAVRG
ncbi:MAG: DUF2459 domain-containing protein [Rhodobacteraceae bacterium]|nr:MAG: DUF2459 domain-containing protein [Paracoccaceae bacterium]